MLDYDAVKGFAFRKDPLSYGAKDAILYALALGYGEDPLDERQLRYVTENDQCVAPTMPVVFCHPGLWIKEPQLGLDWRKFVHMSQRLRLEAPLATAGSIVSHTYNAVVADRGEGRGAVIVQRREMSDAASGQLVAVIEATYLARGDGGFSAGGGQSDPLPDASAAAGAAAGPAVVLELETLPQAALLYRLSGDMNPLHSSPAAAKAAGFDRPILHGLCTFGVAARAVLAGFCDYDGGRLKDIQARFSAPVFPGETIRFAMTPGESGVVHFEASVPARDVTVLKDGLAIVKQVQGDV
ncbi:MAG TPA: MaoC/PaaZ C-terminal domain-containing protein [Novosphingobium sp.]|nr:MaoC/PaaZ C-terminal domain-containing protein [Novosphingobium sp.]